MIQVLPAEFNFGTVTAGNGPADLIVTIKNRGSVALNTTGISLAAPSNSPFSLGLSGGSKPCGQVATSIAAGDFCTFRIGFAPSSDGTFNSGVQIRSNDAASPAVEVALSGASSPVAALAVRVNQMDTACQIGNETTAYVSVTDQGGYVLSNLLGSNFSVRQDGMERTITAAAYVENVVKPIAIAAVLDHSGSMTDQAEVFADMKSGFTDLFSRLGPGDVGEVVKFDSEVEVVQAFTSDSAALVAAIAAPFDKGRFTKLYDAVYQAVDHASARTAYRRAVVVATDGVDEGATAGAPASTRTLTDVINLARSRNVPIFTIGIGASIDEMVLANMAGETGGLHYRANTSQNLATIHQQLTTILYKKQYVLKFDQLTKGAAGIGSTLNFRVSTPLGVTGTAAASISSCN